MTTRQSQPHRSGAGVVAIPGRTSPRPVTYVVLPDADKPFLLARVRWPDVYQAISPVRPDWQEDPGLFDLPYAPTSVQVSYDEAAEIAAEWGAHLPAEDGVQRPGPALIRRMPSDWSNLSTAERRAWSVEIDKDARRAMATASVREFAAEKGLAPPAAPGKRRRWGRRRAQPGLAAPAPLAPPGRGAVAADDTLVIDLTEPAGAASVAAEPA